MKLTYKDKIWLSQQEWFRLICKIVWHIKKGLLPECGHISTCKTSFMADCVLVNTWCEPASCPTDCQPIWNGCSYR